MKATRHLGFFFLESINLTWKGQRENADGDLFRLFDLAS